MNCCYRLIDKISHIARLAGMEIMKIYDGRSKFKIDVKKKLDQSFVTNADLSSNELILYFLKYLTPTIPIISEENLPNWKECKEWDCFWLVDPLDGTKDFLLRNGEFTVNIAFVRYGEPVMGVIYVPAYNMLYAASNGYAWKVYDFGIRETLKISEINTYTIKNPIVIMSKSKMSSDQEKFFYNYLIKMKNYRISKISSSFKFCLIAEGLAQFYPRFSSSKIWDTAAGHAIVKSAGAVVSDWNGYPLNYKNINRYFSNPGFQVSLY